MGSHRRLTEGIEAPQKPLTPVKMVSKIALIFVKLVSKIALIFVKLVSKIALIFVKLVSKIGKLFGIFEGLKRCYRIRAICVSIAHGGL